MSEPKVGQVLIRKNSSEVVYRILEVGEKILVESLDWDFPSYQVEIDRDDLKGFDVYEKVEERKDSGRIPFFERCQVCGRKIVPSERPNGICLLCANAKLKPI